VHNLAPLLVTLAALILATKLFGELAQRIGQPAVLGELLAGVLLGPSLLRVVAPTDPVLESLALLGVLILLFEIGLHTDIRSLREVGKHAAVVAVVGVVAPFVGGYLVAVALGFSSLESLVAGAALTATSIGISARVLRDLGRLDTPEGQVVLGAAVLDDLIGLIILSVVTAAVGGAGISAFGITKSAVVAIGFVVAALAVGSFAVPPIFRIVERLRTTGALGLIAIAFAFLLAWAADASGSAMIIGALAAGMVLHRTPQRAMIERSVTQLGYFFVPIFFALVGAMVDLRALVTPAALVAGVALTVVGIAGKLVSGYALRGFEGSRLVVGVAMIPRGEVGLIFAQVGLATGAIAAGQFGAIMLMVIATTLVTPPWLSAITRTKATRTVDPTGEGLGDLVSGARPMTPRSTQPVKRDYNIE
jgi:Kef-type K+ transport system membrane component KefB